LGGALKYSYDDGKFDAEAPPIPRGKFDTHSYGGMLHVGFVPIQRSFNLGAGIVLVAPRGFSPFLNYRALVGYNEQKSHTVSAGLRIEF
jgi:hypothetical protein